MWYHYRQDDNLCVFLILVVLCYVLIHISTDASTLSTASGTPSLCDRNSAECHILALHRTTFSSAFGATSMSHCMDTSLPSSLLLSSQYPVDADVDQALIPPSYLHLNQGTHGGYGTRQLMMSEEGFPAAQNLYWLPSDESASISMYIVCHPLHLCAGILVLLLLRLICQ